MKLGLRLWVGLLSMSMLICGCAGTVKKDVKAAIQALDEGDTKVHEDHVRDRVADALSLWSKSLVQGAMSHWSDPDAQASFRKQTTELASSTVNGAVDGAVAGLSDPEHMRVLKDRLSGLLEGVLDAAARSVRAELTPAIHKATTGAVTGIAEGVRSDLGPALHDALDEQVGDGLADALRRRVGQALHDVITDDIAEPLNSKLTPALEKLVTGVGGAVNGQALEAERNAALGAKKLAYEVAAALCVIALAIGGLALLLWRRAKVHGDTVALLARAIKNHERSSAVQDVLMTIRKEGRDTPAGNNLDRFLTDHPTLRVPSRTSAAESLAA